MEANLRQKWTADLRSGKYKQGRYSLYVKSTGKYCGLGVLGLCMGLNEDTLAGKGLLDIVCKYKSIECPLSNKEVDHLMRLNDTEKKTFEEIADYVDENL